MKKFYKDTKFSLFLIIAAGTLLRLYKINSPILDLYPVRQEQCAMMARNFFRDGLNILNGKIDWYGNLNPRLVIEFPLISYLSAIGYKIFGIHEFIGRLIAVLFSLGSIAIFYLLVKDFFDRKVGILAALIFTILPLNLYFSRVFMPESLMMFFSLALVWSFNRWLESNRKIYYIIALITGSLAFLVKFTMVFLLAILGYLAYLRWRGKIFLRFSLWSFIILILAPLAFWHSRGNMNLLPEPLVSLKSVIGMLINPHFYLRMFMSFGVFVFTPLGIFPFMVGFLRETENQRQKVFYIWFIVLILYLFFTPVRNYVHFYYQLPFVPVMALFMSRGIISFVDWNYWKTTFLKKFNPKVITAIFIILIFLSSWLSIQPCYKYNHAVYEVGLKMRQLTRPDSLIIAGRCYSQAPLYYCDRKGWEINEEGKLCHGDLYYGKDFPAIKDEIDLLKNLISRGANYYLACDLKSFYANPDLVNYLNTNYDIVLKSDKYLVYSLDKTKEKAIREKK